MATLLNRLRSKKKDAPVEEKTKPKKKGNNELPELSGYISKKDYAGAISFIQFQQTNVQYDPYMELWLGHCYFRNGDFKEANEVYKKMAGRMEFSDEVFVYIGCCYFFQAMYTEAKEYALKGAPSSLQNRLLFHTAQKLKDEKDLMIYHQKLQQGIEDQLSFASMNFLRMHYSEALDTCKRILENNSNFLACNFYISLCFYKLDFYENALECIKPYLQHFPESPAAQNLRACIAFKLGNTSIHLDMSNIESLYPAVRVLFKHNSVVFSEGSNALQIFPALLEFVPEARLNLMIYYIASGDVEAAHKLGLGFEPASPNEYLLKAVTYLLMGRRNFSKDHLIVAKECFKIVGESAAECDTIPGRQAMAAYKFLEGEFHEVVTYLESIRSFYYNDDTFCMNYAQSLVMCDRFDEAITVLSEISRPSSLLHNQLLIRSYVMTLQPAKAWEVFMKVMNPVEHQSLLKIIAHDAYITKQFICTARAYDALEKLDPSPDHWLGKRAAVSAQFALLVQGQCTGAEMAEVLTYLQHGTHSQIEVMTNTIKKWARENGVTLA